MGTETREERAKEDEPRGIVYLEYELLNEYTHTELASGCKLGPASYFGPVLLLDLTSASSQLCPFLLESCASFNEVCSCHLLPAFAVPAGVVVGFVDLVLQVLVPNRRFYL